MKLIYFDTPGRAEASRLILAIGKIPYEESPVTPATWPEVKAKMPFGQVPVLQLDDGTMLAQSGAIERYCAKLAGLYPKDPLTAAFGDMACLFISDTFNLLAPSFSMPAEEKIKTRRELVSGKIKDNLLMLAKHMEKRTYVAGQELSWADIVVFCYLGWFKGGAVDGIPTTVLDEYPVLAAFFNRIAGEQPVKEHYADATGARKAYQPSEPSA